MFALSFLFLCLCMCMSHTLAAAAVVAPPKPHPRNRNFALTAVNRDQGTCPTGFLDHKLDYLFPSPLNVTMDYSQTYASSPFVLQGERA